MTERIHDDEPNIGEDVVRALLEAQLPQWTKAPVEYLQTSGTDNAMWRVRLTGEPDVIVRLPRRPDAAAKAQRETSVLQQVGAKTIGPTVSTPLVRHVGAPHPKFPYSWSALQWIEGTDAWSSRNDLNRTNLSQISLDLGQVVRGIGAITNIYVPKRVAGSRGGPLLPLLERLDEWLNDPVWNAEALIDVSAIKRMRDEAAEVADEPVTLGFVHGDLIPGNLLLKDGLLAAVIDWGGAGIGDTAQDLAPAWSVLSGISRAAFREATGADEEAWIRGRTFELEHAVGAVLYYKPRQHELGDVMELTLNRILTDS